MPPRTKFTQDDIIEAGLQIVRQTGIENLSARTIARRLNSSTMPIFSSIKSMKNLETLLLKKAADVAFEYQTTPRTNDVILDMAIGYILFAREEKHLFRLLNHTRENIIEHQSSTHHFDKLSEVLAESPQMSNYSRDQRRLLVLKSWVFAHGLCDLLGHSANVHIAALREDEEKLISFVTEVYRDFQDSSNAVGDLIFALPSKIESES